MAGSYMNMYRGMDDAHVWHAASYARLSVDDGEAGRSSSILSQQRIIDDWVSKHPDVEIVERFVDDGWSGSNFDRPGFKSMIAAMEAGAIDCILVKDLSRLGRNYLETGRLLERVFPAKGVRLVAVNDGYDGLDIWGAGSLTADSSVDTALLVPFKNLINDFYCAMTSSKVKAALSIRRREGLYVGARAPYGYAKDPENKNRLVIDPDAAAVVMRIFELRAQGETFAGIAQQLNDANVPSPAEYAEDRRAQRAEEERVGIDGRAAFGESFGDWGWWSDGADDDGDTEDEDDLSSKCGWNASYVRRILTNRTYIGVLVQGRTFKPSFRQQERLAYPPEFWTYSEGACPAIVDEELFDLVQRLGETALSVKGRRSANPLRGLAFCAKCGSRLSMHSSTSAGKRYAYLRCANDCKLSVRADTVMEEVERKLGSIDRAFLLKCEARVDVDEGGVVSVSAGLEAQGAEP